MSIEKEVGTPTTNFNPLALTVIAVMAMVAIGAMAHHIATCHLHGHSSKGIGLSFKVADVAHELRQTRLMLDARLPSEHCSPPAVASQ